MAAGGGVVVPPTVYRSSLCRIGPPRRGETGQYSFHSYLVFGPKVGDENSFKENGQDMPSVCAKFSEETDNCSVESIWVGTVLESIATLNLKIARIF